MRRNIINKMDVLTPALAGVKIYFVLHFPDGDAAQIVKRILAEVHQPANAIPAIPLQRNLQNSITT